MPLIETPNLIAAAPPPPPLPPSNGKLVNIQLIVSLPALDGVIVKERASVRLAGGDGGGYETVEIHRYKLKARPVQAVIAVAGTELAVRVAPPVRDVFFLLQSSTAAATAAHSVVGRWKTWV